MSPVLLAAWLACQTFDTVSTQRALRQPGTVELNPILRASARVPVKVGINVAGLWAYRKSHKTVIPVVFIASGCAAGAWNTHVSLQR